MHPTRRLVAPFLLAIAAQAAIAGLTARAEVFFGFVRRASVLDDVAIYRRYAGAIAAGEVPYRDFAVEYPPLSLPLFVAPRLLGRGFGAYWLGFAAEMFLFNAAAVWLLAARAAARGGPGAVGAALGWHTACFATVCPLAMARFDLAPATLAFAAMACWDAGRPALGGVSAAAGALVKVFPAAVVPPAAAMALARSGVGSLRGLVAFATAAAAGTAGWIALGGDRVEDTVAYHSGRGLEIGSLWAGLLMVVARATGAPLVNVFDHTSNNTVTPWSAAVASLAPPLQAAAVALAAWRSVHPRPGDAARYGAAALLGFMLFGKVFSPQYVIWLLPFIAALGGRVGRVARPTFLLACLATTAIYPWSLGWLQTFDPRAIALLNARNLILLGLLGVLLFAREEPAGPGPAGDTP